MNKPALGPLGLFGGTFDPLHIGHLRLAIEAGEALGLTEVCFIPAGSPALRDAPQSAAEHRLSMVKRTLAAFPRFSIDAAEVLNAASGTSYSIITLERQRRRQGAQRPMVLLLGADAFAKLEAWHRWRELFDLAHIAVATRPGHEWKVGAGDTALDQEFAARQGTAADLTSSPAGRIVPFSITGLEVSATAIRQRLAKELSIRYLVPEPVLDYIDFHKLYRTPHGH